MSRSAESEFLGQSEAVKNLLRAAHNAAIGSDRPVLITGPVGSGKSLLARHVHTLSSRRRGPLEFVDCGALSDLENELFGHRQGSFTGAVRTLRGRLGAAHGGCLVLDDFERLNHHQQDLLHRVLVDGSYHPLGSERSERVDVRFIATTNKDVRSEVLNGRLKQDFVSRLDYFPLTVPSLAQRLDDLPLLAQELLRQNAEELVRKGLRTSARVDFDPDCWPALKARPFEDNVRGLDKLVVRLLAFVGDVPVIRPADIATVAPALPPVTERCFERPWPLRVVREAAERDYILEVCRHANHNYRQVARILDISPKSLYVRLRQYGIERPTF
jgi:DNA-binding NtrC family response regulator